MVSCTRVRFEQRSLVMTAAFMMPVVFRVGVAPVHFLVHLVRDEPPARTGAGSRPSRTRTPRPRSSSKKSKRLPSSSPSCLSPDAPFGRLPGRRASLPAGPSLASIACSHGFANGPGRPESPRMRARRHPERSARRDPCHPERSAQRGVEGSWGAWDPSTRCVRSG